MGHTACTIERSPRMGEPQFGQAAPKSVQMFVNTLTEWQVRAELPLSIFDDAANYYTHSTNALTFALRVLELTNDFAKDRKMAYNENSSEDSDESESE